MIAGRFLFVRALIFNILMAAIKDPQAFGQQNNKGVTASRDLTLSGDRKLSPVVESNFVYISSLLYHIYMAAIRKLTLPL
jgi:hypothetical protein